MATKKAIEGEIVIKPIEEAYMIIHIVGDTPLIVSAWSTKAKQEMLDAQTGGKKEKKQRVAKNVWGEVAGRLYWMDGEPDVDYSDWTEKLFVKHTQGARFGFPAAAFKKAAISAAYRGGYTGDMVSLRGEFFIMGEGEQQLVQISEGYVPSVREDNVKLQGKTADLRHRPQFETWSAKLIVKYDVNGNISPKSIINMINLGGQKNGIGEWRIEKGGQYGMYHVDHVE